MRIARSLTRVSQHALCQGVYLVPGGCTWSWGVYLVPWGVTGPMGSTWSQGAPGTGGCTWSLGGGCLLLGGCTWSQGGVCFQRGIPGPGGVSVPEGTWSQGVSAWGVYLVVGVYLIKYSPPVDRQTPVNILSCPKLRLRAVKIVRCTHGFENGGFYFVILNPIFLFDKSSRNLK